MIIIGSFLPSLRSSITKVYSGRGADTVYAISWRRLALQVGGFAVNQELEAVSIQEYSSCGTWATSFGIASSRAIARSCSCVGESMSATTRNWIVFWLAALLLAGVARYFGPGRVLFTFGYGQTAKGPPGECRHKLPHSRNRNFD